MSLIQRSTIYYALVVNAYDKYDTNFRSLVMNTPVMADTLPFTDIASTVMQDLSELNQGNKDAAITNAVNALMDIVNNNGVPEPAALWNAVNNAVNQVKSKSNNDKDKNRNATYLLNLTKIIIAKYFNPQNQGQQAQPTEQPQAPAPQAKTQQNLVKFLQTAYRTLVSNKTLTPTDIAYWNANKGVLVGRLNSLTRMKARTKQQEQERYIIQYIKNKIDVAAPAKPTNLA